MNDNTPLFLKALQGLPLDRPPVWIMRQAGRYLPDFMTLKNKYDFFTRCQTPELATEITLMPIKQIGLDAAIIFSDILVILQAMGIDVEMKNSIGPWIETPIRNQSQLKKIIIPDIEDSLGYVLEAIKLSKKELNDEVPLIGFAGSPWTLLCYAVEGKGSKDFHLAKNFCFSNPKIAHEFLQKITTTTIKYLKSKVNAGADVIVTSNFSARRKRMIDNNVNEHFNLANKKAGELALKAKEVSKKKILIAGSLPAQYNTYLPD